MLNDKTYLDYIGTRPRVEKHGAHGLFSDDDYIDLDVEREKLNQHQRSSAFVGLFSDARRCGIDRLQLR